MNDLLIITPVKDAIDTASQAINKIVKSKNNFEYLVYNDLSTEETKTILLSMEGFRLMNIEELVDTPSPNYRFTLIDSQEQALKKNAHLLIIESDVFVKKDTIEKLFNFANKHEDAGMVAAITVDEKDQVNFPYEYVKAQNADPLVSTHRLSFCCTLLTNRLLSTLDFKALNDKKDWFDVQISKDSRSMGLRNYILPDVRVEHIPHSSRPWKKLKYSNPLKYYLKKWILKKDKI